MNDVHAFFNQMFISSTDNDGHFFGGKCPYGKILSFLATVS